MKQRLLTTREAAEELSVDEWQVRRLFEDGTLPEPSRFGGKRVISEALLAAIREAMILRGWLTREAVR